MPFELHVALRYLLAKRKQAFISVISLISILGVLIGVMALVIALALMTGMQHALRDRLLGSTAHVYVWKIGRMGDYHQEMDKLRKLPHVMSVSPATLDYGLISSGDRRKFLSIKGVDPALERQVTDLGHSMVAGRLSDIARESPDQPPGIVLGKDLASDLNVSVGDEVNLLTAQGTLTPNGMMPRMRRLKVVGIFNLGLNEYDSQYGIVSLPTAERLLNRTEPEYFELRLDDIYRASEVAADVTARLGPSYYAQDWASMNKSLYSALWLEKMAISITIGLIIIVAALNIVASLILLVMEKHRDIAILKTMGASARSIMTIFMLQGLVIGVIGTAVGGAAGWVVASVFDRYRLLHLPSDVYQISYVPFTIQGLDFALVIAAAVLICFVATLYPARQAARLEPAEALRYG